MDFRGSFQTGGYQPGPPIGDGQPNNKRNGQRIIPQGNLSPQTIYLDQSPNTQIGYAYINPMQQQQPMQQVHQVPSYGRAAGPQTVGGGNIHVIGGPQQSQPPQIQTITSNPATSASPASAYVVPGGAYITTTPTNAYQYQVYAQNKQIPNAIAAPIPQNMAYAQIIPEGDSIYQQSKQQYMSRSPKPIQTSHITPPQLQQSIQLKSAKPEIGMQPQMQSHYGVGMNSQMRQQQQHQMMQQQDGEPALTSNDTFKPNYKQPPGLFNIVARGDLPSINFVCDVDSCYETE